jgi:hypothetical protein
MGTAEEAAVVGGPAMSEGPAERSPLPSTHSFRIAGSSIKPRSNNVDYQVSGSGGCVFVSGGSATAVWNAPLWLPRDATVNYLRIYYDDTSGSNSMAWFTVYDLYGNIVDEFSVSSDGSAGNGYSDTALIEHQIDYSRYSYVVNWRPNVTGSAMQLCGFRLYYFDPNVFSHGFDHGDTFGWSAVVQ